MKKTKRGLILVLALCLAVVGLNFATTNTSAATPTQGSEKYTYVYITKANLNKEIKDLEAYAKNGDPMATPLSAVLAGASKAVPVGGAYFTVADKILTYQQILDRANSAAEAKYLKGIYNKMGTNKYAKFKIRSVWSYVKPPQIYGWKYMSKSFVKYTSSTKA